MSKHDIYVSELVFEDGGLRGPKGESGDAPSLTVAKVAPYLYTVDYNDWDYLDAQIYAEYYFPMPLKCATIMNGDIMGHNHDGAYDESADFIVRTIASKGRHASVGMASMQNQINAPDIDAGVESEELENFYKVLPFFVVDGMNDAGVMCAMNSMPDDYWRTSGTNQSGDAPSMVNCFLVRYILDYADSVAKAIELLNGVSVRAPKKETSLMISDKTRTIRVEFIYSQIVITELDHDSPEIMTNFHFYGYDGTDASLECHANGVERYNILLAGIESAGTDAGIAALLKSVRYTGIYNLHNDPFWYSDYRGKWEFNGELIDLNKDTPIETYLPIVRQEINKYAYRTRDGQTAQTIHTAVYNRDWKTLRIYTQEDDTEHCFCFADMAEMAEHFYTKGEVDTLIADAETEVLANVADHYDTKEAVAASLREQYVTITEETDTKLAGKMDDPSGEGEAGQIIVNNGNGSEWQDMPETLPPVTAADNDKVMVVEDGVWVLSDKYADYFRYVNLTVQITADDGGVPTNLTVDLKNADTGDIINSKIYLGQPVTFHVPRGMHYIIEQYGVWEGYHNPTPAYIESAATEDRTLIFTYEAIQIPQTLRELEIIVQGGGAASLANHIGLQFDDVYEEDGIEYNIIWDLKAVKQVRDADNAVHTGVFLQWHYATPQAMPFDAPERVQVDLNVETTAQPGMYYYGQTGSNYRLLTLNAGDPLPTTYDALYKNEIRSNDGDILRRGYGHYGDSAVRKWLNSAADAGEWFEPSHVGDAAPAQAVTMSGFMRGCSDQILGMAMPVRINTAAYGEEMYTVCDEFFIPSVTEVYGVNSIEEGTAWEDWIEATDFSEPSNSACEGRKTYMLETVASQDVGLRTANTAYQYVVWNMKANGSLDGYVNASVAKRYAPCCVTYKKEG